MKQTIKAVKLLRKEMISNPNIDRKLIDQFAKQLQQLVQFLFWKIREVSPALYKIDY